MISYNDDKWMSTKCLTELNYGWGQSSPTTIRILYMEPSDAKFMTQKE